MVFQAKMGQVSALNLAGYILKHYGPMSHLKTQKMLYYAQAYHLAKFGKPLFEEDFQAWMHGPVCREVFDVLRDKSLLYDSLNYESYDSLHDSAVEANLNADQLTWINSILGASNKKTGEQLEELSHKEQPWVDARKGYGPGQICTAEIPKTSIKSFYGKKLNG